MDTKFNFSPAICTSREQSDRLLALGLKPETADMIYHSYGYIIDEFGNKERRFKLPTIRDTKDYEGKYDIPAWSLGRLIEIIPSTIRLKEGLPTFYPYAFLDLSPVAVSYTWHDYDAEDRNLAGFYGNGLFAAIVDAIEWLIKEGYFNNEYLV